MAKNIAKQKRRKRLFFLGTLSCSIIFFTVFMIGRNVVDIFGKYREKSELEKELISLKEEEDQLQVDAEKLQDPDYVARYAREKYMYSKDGEFILRIP